jgi:pilus assembly protein CpaF
VASAIDVVIQLTRLSDGCRRLAALEEITGMEGEVVTMQEIFTLERRGVDAQGQVLAEIVPTGIRPRFTDKIRLAGIELSHGIFEPRRGSR